VFLAPQIHAGITRFQIDMVGKFSYAVLHFKIIVSLEKTFWTTCSETNDCNYFFNYQSKYPILARFYKAYMELPAFQAAVPENQPDAPSS
jgi:glutathione S-transferase